MTVPAIAITAGEPAGIGPELVARLALRHRERPWPARIVVFGNQALIGSRARRIGLAPDFVPFDAAGSGPDSGAVEIWDEPLTAPVVPGRPDPVNAASVVGMLTHAADACATGACTALVTAPVQKSVLVDAGFPFTGHTEFLAARTGTPRVVMLLVGGGYRVALVTTHLALSAVPAAITREAVAATIAIVAAALARDFGIARPRLAVCGLNPHAGEGGHLGREEIDVIAPAIAAARDDGHDVAGPLSADTAFVPDIARRCDAIVAMYHDQGLPALKAAAFGGGVNATLGLPFVRTSVDHGTALDLAADAGRARTADPGSLFAAVDLAVELAARRG
ncbi:MAG TPA: 4-hydroxythreonine-4-phosphate dehydrogenase PdxA [Casimicrobiaceae bacterium]|nr:4-hydroxythreonine-4-phosphate dehydrogenase PdxA [Casimicrobiaceae bacterium]